jgi:hypothetical protein
MMNLLTEDINRIKTLMNISEGKTVFPSEDKRILDDFINFVKKELNIKYDVDIEFRDDKGEKQEIKTTAVYQYSDKDPESDVADIKVHAGERYLNDIMRSVAHELVHHQQNENGKLKGKISNVGGAIEDEANAVAGELLKKYGVQHPEIYDNENIKGEFTEDDEGGDTGGATTDTSGDSSSTNANVSTWETGLTRGPANQITITVWNSNLNRGKGNTIDQNSKWESGVNRGKSNPLT